MRTHQIHYLSLFVVLALFVNCNSQNPTAPPLQPQIKPQSDDGVNTKSQPKPDSPTVLNPSTEKIAELTLAPKAQQQAKLINTNKQTSQPLKITILQNAKQIETLPEPTIETTDDTTTFTAENGQQVSFQIDPLEENIIEKEQRKAQSDQIKWQESKLHPWVASQFQKFPETDQIQTHEIFSFQITEQSEFKWNPTQFKSGPLKFVVEVFNYARGDITLPENPEEDDFLEILSKSENSSSYTNLGKVYLKKLFTINFFSDFQMIKIVNRYEKKMFVQLSLEATKFVPEKALDDDTLKIPAEKIKSILEQLQETQMKREKTYRSEWSFRDRQEHHQSQMLILTGVELIVILGTAIVQMYCIKNLFDNRLIV